MPGARDPDGLRGHLPGLRTRLLRLLRPARVPPTRASLADLVRRRPLPPRGRLACSPASRPGPSRSAPSSTPMAARRARRPPRGNPSMHDTDMLTEHDRRLRGRHRRPHPGRGRRLAPAERPRRRGREGAPRDLRGAALLRAARRRADARRGHRHRGPHLRDLPGRLPDDRGPRLRARAGDPHRPADPGAAPAALLRRVDREPRAACLPAPPARLPGLRQRPRAGPATTAPRSRAGLALKKAGNRIVELIGGRRHPSGLRPGRRLLAHVPADRDHGPPRVRRRRPSRSPRRRSSWSPACTRPTSSARPAGGAPPSRPNTR